MTFVVVRLVVGASTGCHGPEMLGAHSNWKSTPSGPVQFTFTRPFSGLTCATVSGVGTTAHAGRLANVVRMETRIAPMNFGATTAIDLTSFMKPTHRSLCAIELDISVVLLVSSFYRGVLS